MGSTKFTRQLEAMIRALVVEEMAKVLPLHQSPQAAEPTLVEHRPQECPGAKCPEYINCSAPLLAGQILADVHKECGYVWAMHRRASPEYASNTGLALCVDPLCIRADCHAEHDPDPKAVGHPEAPGVDWRSRVGMGFDYCTGCGHSWSRHGVGAGNCNVRFAGTACGCEQVRADHVRSAQ